MINEEEVKEALIKHLSDPKVVIRNFTIDQSESNPPFLAFSVWTINLDQHNLSVNDKVIELLKRATR